MYSKPRINSSEINRRDERRAVFRFFRGLFVTLPAPEIMVDRDLVCVTQKPDVRDSGESCELLNCGLANNLP